MGLQPRQAHAALPSQILFQATRWKREQQDALSRTQLQVSAGQRSPPSCSVCSGQSRVTKGTMKTIKAVTNLLLLSYLRQPFKVIVSVTSCVFSPGLQSTTLWMEWRSEHSTKHLGSDLMSWYSDRWGFYFLIASSLRPLENHSIDPLNRSNNVAQRSKKIQY